MVGGEKGQKTRNYRVTTIYIYIYSKPKEKKQLCTVYAIPIKKINKMKTQKTKACAKCTHSTCLIIGIVNENVLNTISLNFNGLHLISSVSLVNNKFCKHIPMITTMLQYFFLLLTKIIYRNTIEIRD